MKIKNKIISLIAVVSIAIPQIVLAQGFDWNIGVGGDNWSVDIGSGGGSGGPTGLPGGRIIDIVANVLDWLLIIIGIVSIIGFIIAGILYLTSAGDETQAGKAKKAMLYSIIGVIVGLSGLVMLNAAFNLLDAGTF